ncbi:MAG TPA: AI-2E family transporter [Thermoanaerobaculia bacterium]|nr:AI-2E family transporter [Thermoanaerobaculia bacterium]
MTEEKKLSRWFFIAALVLTTILFFRMMQAFLVPIALAAVFATIFDPLYQGFLRTFRGRRSLAAFFSCFVLFLGLVLPLYGVGHLVTVEAINFYRSIQGDVTRLVQGGNVDLIRRIKSIPWLSNLPFEQINLQEDLQKAAAGIAAFMAGLINRTSRSTLEFVVLLFITLFTMFYFFRDGRTMVRRLRFLIPLDREYKNAILARFTAVARATVKGTLLIALVQGSLSGLTLWIFGVGSPFLWGVVATLLSIIPLVGAWLVLYPAAAVQALQGNYWQAIGILLATVIVIVNVDNLLRPRLVGQETGMHDLMVFFSTLGGIGLFGATGFILGPMLAALFLSLLDIYSQEFKDDLDTTATLPLVAQPPPLAPPPQSGRGETG